MPNTPTRFFYKVVNHRFAVIDGDTIDCMVDLGFETLMFHRFRMVGYDAPETYRPKTPQEKAMGMQVKTYLKSLCDDALKSDSLYVKSLGNRDAYGRYSAEIYTFADGQPVVVNSLVMQFMQQNTLTKESLGDQSRLGSNRL